MSARETWVADMERILPALERYVIDIEGSAYLDPDTPAYLADLHSKLCQIGYANGWIPR